ncbi:MAG TPA: methionine--tRNA ligase [Polyangiaceae bacterium]|nr:methionine--tRNA ligase [Polyangiaceae bacterium]
MDPAHPDQRRLLVTSALPYANGHIHIGHLVEYLQTDIWVRFQRAMGRRAVYVCADDTHGTAIMIRARKEGRSEEALIAEMQDHHRRDFADFQVAFDHYGSTNSEANRALCHEFWAKLRGGGLVSEQDVTQLFDPEAGTFLADRFVKGTCPNCKSVDQYGDACEKCGTVYSAADLIDPRSTLSGAKPELRTAKHLFVEIEKLHGFLDGWTATPGVLQPEIANYLKGHFLGDELRAWDVSRPAPYFGFEIPDAPGNFWYVWFDAPIGYIASTAEWCQGQGEKLEDWWKSADCEVRHFIGKDITYFHTLFWPAMLETAGYSLPSRVQVHGFLTVNGEKMSKSRGTMVRARTYLDHLDPAFLRYFYASKLSDKVDDLDLEVAEFVAKVNSDLVGKVVNLASRTARFVPSLSAVFPDDEGLFARGAEAGAEIARAYESHEFAKAMRLIMNLADRANEYIDRKEPWKLKKDAARVDELRDVCTVALNLYRQLIVYLGPVLPKQREDSERLLNCSLSSWSAASQPSVGQTLGEFTHLMTRVDAEKVRAMIESSKEEQSAAEPAAAAPAAASSSAAPATENQDDGAALAAEPLAAVCSIDDFGKVDLRVARVISAEQVPEAKKLLKLTVSLGGEDRRTIFAGIKSAYEPEQLVGRLVVVVANLAPRQMKFGLSEGMVVCAGGGGSDLFVLSPDSGAKAGQRIH